LESFLIFAAGYTLYTSPESSKISMKAHEPAERPPPKSKNDLGLYFGYLYFIYVINLKAAANVLGALLRR
jgi:hypothetical protein